MASIFENRRQPVNGGKVTTYLIDDGRVVGFGYQNSPVVVNGKRNTLDAFIVGERNGSSEPITRTIPVYRSAYSVLRFMTRISAFRVHRAERKIRDEVEWATGFPSLTNQLVSESSTVMGFTGVMASRHTLSGSEIKTRVLGIYQDRKGEKRIVSDKTLQWVAQEDNSETRRRIRKMENKAQRTAIWAQLADRAGLRFGKKLEAVFAS